MRPKQPHHPAKSNAAPLPGTPSYANSRDQTWFRHVSVADNPAAADRDEQRHRSQQGNGNQPARCQAERKNIFRLEPVKRGE